MKPKGLSIIEILVGLAILGITMASIIPGFMQSMRINNNNELRSNGVYLASQRLEELRQGDVTSLPTTGSTSSTVTRSGRTFTVVTKYCVMSAYCESASRHLQIEVVFGGRVVYVAETVFTDLQ